MKKHTTLFLLTLVSLTACQQKNYQELEGQWYWTLDPEYILDTLDWEDDFELGIERITINTDTGVVVTEYREDSLISIRKYTKVRVAEFSFDDLTHGVLSQYDMDTLRPGRIEDLRYTARNNNFWIVESEGQSKVIFDYHFNQYGRLTDTLEFKIRDDVLIIRDDTLYRLDIHDSHE